MCNKLSTCNILVFQTSMSESLSLPIPGDILRVVIDFLYTDDATALKGCEDVEFVCNVLVVADQLLILRLKDFCQEIVAQLMTLKNCCELLEFACVYNADQLKAVCQQYIVISLASLLETRMLDVMTDDVIDELSQYYRGVVTGMCRRVITPYDGWPDHAYLESLQQEAGGAGDQGTSATPSKRSGKRRKRNRTKSSGDAEANVAESQETLRHLSVCSELSDLAIEEDGEEHGHDQAREKVLKEESQKMDVEASSPEPISPSSPVVPSSPPEPSFWCRSTGTTLGSAGQGLRAIMEAEQRSQQKPQPKVVQSHPKATKISQKERKKLQQQNKAQETQNSLAQSPPVNPW